MPLDPISAAYTAADNRKNSGEKNVHLLKGKTSNYNILDIISKGTFGKVAEGVNLSTKKDVAIKILETEKTQITEKEIDMIEVLSILDPVKTNVVHFHEKLQQGQHTYLVFEKLDMNLEQLLKNRKYIPLSVSEIQLITQQLLTALEALRGLGIIHTNLKPDNIMLVNHKDQPFRVKLIDFGMALRTSKVRRGMVMQSLGYRAPEVSLGLPISGAVDLWGLGCILTYLYLSKELFDMGCEYQMMRSMVNVLGKPDDKLLNAGKYTYQFFKANKPRGKWSLKSPWEYMQGTGIKPKNMRQTVSSLSELDTIYPEIQDPIEKMDRRAFINLLKLLLHMDPALRITSAAALQHPFVSMSHMEQELDTSL
ncbi:homeodomain-interacting protein kinase 4-like [Paralichthys olivaceus]|uniref:homeodomain-interacting protein kinase 4-like n=1 Tax=Paralichthys olivaceus TaxID=8255 RepID=UPI00097DD6FF|nr:PREDICTED: homeodomain-interacting protein kinase 4-like [Paralichthys olivaceus]